MAEDAPFHATLDETELTARLEPTRAAGLARLARFAPATGRRYKTLRNYDFGPDRRDNVSMLSAHIRRRLVSEREVVGVALSSGPAPAVEKFVQEVFWRTYWKGWLELRPAVWREYRAGLAADLDRLAEDSALRRRVEAAETGATGLDCFDAWAAELAETGYLHNHARMWFASIWIFTLRLPWRLGADLFLRRLLDGDPASNTLSWRWVAGLQTRGKNYVATAWNVEKFTDGRFNPIGALADRPAPLAEAEPPPPPLDAPRDYRAPVAGRRTAVLLTEDDLSMETARLLDGLEIVAVGALAATERRSPRGVDDAVRNFDQRALADAAERVAEGLAWSPVTLERVVDWAVDAGAEQILSPYTPQGWTNDALVEPREKAAAVGLDWVEARRDWDTVCWPHATRGFFKFKERIPHFLTRLG